MISLAQFCSALRPLAPLGSTHRSASPRIATLLNSAQRNARGHLEWNTSAPSFRRYPALRVAAQLLAPQRNATPRSAPLLASSRLCRSPHLDATQCSDARLGLSSLSAQRAALLRSSTRLCSSRRNAPPLATGPLLLRPGLEADLTMPTICRFDTAAEAPRARARTASSRSRHAFEPVFEWFSVDHGRTSPVEWPLFIAFHAHAVSGCGLGRRSSIRRRIFVTSALIATSARWHTMQRPWRMIYWRRLSTSSW